MAGYSGTPLAKKLGIDEQARLAVLAAPWDYEKTLGLPPGKHHVTSKLGKSEEFIHLFALQLGDLRLLRRMAGTLIDTGIVWISWPKKASGVPTGVNEELVRQAGMDAGLVDVKVCAVDETWSGLKFVRRLKDRARGR